MTIQARRAAFERACRNHHGQDMAYRRYVLAVARGMVAEMEQRDQKRRSNQPLTTKARRLFRAIFKHGRKHNA